MAKTFSTTNALRITYYIRMLTLVQSAQLTLRTYYQTLTRIQRLLPPPALSGTYSWCHEWLRPTQQLTLRIISDA